MKCLILLIIISLINFSSNFCVVGNEVCPSENCVAPNQCDYTMSTFRGCGSSKICCSIIKEEYRTHCRHHGGECVSSACNPSLIRSVSDCRAGTHCCVLV